MEINLVLAIGIIIVIGFLGGLAIEKIKFPRITGYILVGILFSPSLLNIISAETIENLNIITDIGLGIIAFLIGGSLHIESLSKLGKSITWITTLESIVGWLIVGLALTCIAPFILNIPNASLVHTYFPLAFVIGAAACATAPAAVMAIVHEYKASGPFTTTLLAVVGLDDAVAVIAFALTIGISKPLMGDINTFSLFEMLGAPLIHIAESIAIGSLAGFILIYIVRLVKTSDLLLVISFGMIMLCGGISELLGSSAILANMILGFIIINKTRDNKIFLAVENTEEIIYTMFFVLAGLHFDLGIIKVTGILALLITITRYIGKYFGARVGSMISHAPKEVKKYLGLALLPQAGVSLGLALIGKNIFPAFGDIIVNSIIASVIINELMAPMLTKYALFKAGETNPINNKRE
ncbi:MAG: cation:proton antiporter [Dehalococcoidales bacterium]|nr:cation:proton antiporter [Dehalococcoidales bacterium]